MTSDRAENLLSYYKSRHLFREKKDEVYINFKFNPLKPTGYLMHQQV